MRTLRTELRTISSLLQGPLLASLPHEARMNQFYRGQAAHYDAFRERLLHGRKEMLHALPWSEGETWADFGAGTGWSVESLGPKARALRKIYLVDICEPLLQIARERIRKLGLENVTLVRSEVEKFTEASRLDFITFSYSLTMMPNWQQALQKAKRLLKPGGWIGVVDFELPESPLARKFWRSWFGWDGVHLNGNHPKHLEEFFHPIFRARESGRVPYLLGLRAPYYIFLGKKPMLISRG